MISYEDFTRLAMDASECPTLEGYLSEVGGSITAGDAARTVRLLQAIYTIARSQYDIGIIAEACGMSKRALFMALGIPSRTGESWSSSKQTPSARRASQWAIKLVAYAAISYIVDRD